MKGLNADGRTATYLDTEWGWKPAPGEPRPAQIALQPGQELTYTISRNGFPTSTLRETTAWYVDPNDSVDRYSDGDALAAATIEVANDGHDGEALHSVALRLMAT